MSQGRKRRIETSEVGDVTIVSFVDKRILDEQNIQTIGEQLFELVESEGRRKLLLNFKNVEYLSSAALGKLINLNNKVRKANGQLRLCAIRPRLRRPSNASPANASATPNPARPSSASSPPAPTTPPPCPSAAP